MKKETFLQLIDIIPKLDTVAEPLYNLGIDITECSIISAVGDLVGTIAEEYYGKDGREWIEWWIYEKENNPELKVFETDDNGNEAEILRTVDELYDYLENSIKCNKNKNHDL